MVILGPLQQQVGVRIAARADHVVHTGTVLVPAVPVERVVRDRRHRAQARQRAPHPVAGGQVRRVQRPRLAAEEALRQVVRVPQVKVADLRAFDADDAEELSRGHAECPRLARRHHQLGDLRQPGARRVVERRIERRQFLHRIGHHRRRAAPRRRVRRCRRLSWSCHVFPPHLRRPPGRPSRVGYGGGGLCLGFLEAANAFLGAPVLCPGVTSYYPMGCRLLGGTSSSCRALSSRARTRLLRAAATRRSRGQNREKGESFLALGADADAPVRAPCAQRHLLPLRTTNPANHRTPRQFSVGRMIAHRFSWCFPLTGEAGAVRGKD